MQDALSCFFFCLSFLFRLQWHVKVSPPFHVWVYMHLLAYVWVQLRGMCANTHAWMFMWKLEADVVIQSHPWIILSSYSQGRVPQTQSLLTWLVWLASLFWWSLSLISEAGIIRRPPSLPALTWASVDPKRGLHTRVASTLATEPFPQSHAKVFVATCC